MVKVIKFIPKVFIKSKKPIKSSGKVIDITQRKRFDKIVLSNKSRYITL